MTAGGSLNAHDRLIEAGAAAIRERTQEVMRATFYKDAQKVPADAVAITKLVLAAFLDARMGTTCGDCWGEGVQPVRDGDYEGAGYHEVPCEACSGTGTIPGPLAIIALLRERGVLIQGKLPGHLWQADLNAVVDPAKESKSR